MYVSTEDLERKSLLPVSEVLQLMRMFGSLLISLITLVVAIAKNDKKK
ncbi:putative holin-like toxin [Desemzia sp. FAM 24101]